MPNDIEEEIKISVYSMCMQLYDRNNRPKDALEVASKLKQFHLDTKERDSLCFQEATLLTKLHRWDEASSRYAECPGTTPAERAIVESNLAELEMIVERPDVAVENTKRRLQPVMTIRIRCLGSR